MKKEAETMTALHPFIETLNTRFGGRLSYGSHAPGGAACAMEARNAALGREWSDDVEDFINVIPLNDAPWGSDAVRTEALVPVMLAYWDWPSWTLERQTEVTRRIALLTIQRVLPTVLRAAGMEEHAAACEKAQDLDTAGVSARAASDAARAAAWGAWTSSDAARAARAAADAWKAGLTARNAVLTVACQVWVEAAAM